MTTFSIDNDNAITAFAEYEDALNHRVGATDAVFTNEKELAKLSADWPMSRFADVWNEFAGVVPFDDLKPVKKFTDRKTAVGRIWKAIQALTPAPAQHAAPVAPRDREAKDATPAPETPAKPAKPKTREGTKTAIVLDMLRRADGATLTDIMTATGWQAHSVRGFLSTLPAKAGVKIESFKNADKERTYRLCGAPHNR